MFFQVQVLLNTPPLIPHTPIGMDFSNKWKFLDKLAKYILHLSTMVCSHTPRQKLDQSLCWVFYSFDVLEQCNQQTCVVCTLSHVERIPVGGCRYPPSVRRVVRMVLGLLVLVFDQVSRVDTGAMPAPQLTAVHLCSQPGSWWAAAGGHGWEERSSTLLGVVVVVADVPHLAGLYYLRCFMFRIYNRWKDDFKALSYMYISLHKKQLNE